MLLPSLLRARLRAQCRSPSGQSTLAPKWAESLWQDLGMCLTSWIASVLRSLWCDTSIQYQRAFHREHCRLSYSEYQAERTPYHCHRSAEAASRIGAVVLHDETDDISVGWEVSSVRRKGILGNTSHCQQDRHIGGACRHTKGNCLDSGWGCR